MRIPNRNICLIFAAVLLPGLILSCNKPVINQNSSPMWYASFRDIPGVTKDEIKAIEDLRKETDHFVLGMMLTTEAFYDNNGRIGGYSALLCEWLSGLFDIPFKPEIVEWEPLLSGLANFEIDFTAILTATPERRKTYFMTNAIGMHKVQYFRIRNSVPLEQIAETRPIRYAFLEGTTTIDQVTSRLVPGTYEVILAKDINALYELIKSGKADTAINEETEIFYDIHEDVTASDFYPLIFSPVSLSTQNPALGPLISVVQKALDNGALSFLTTLYNRGNHEYTQHKLFTQFTGEERAFLQGNPVIPFVAAPGNYPVSFYNEKAKQWQGIAFDVLREVESFTGLRFERVNDENARLPAMLDMMENGKASMIMELMYSTERAGNFIWPETALMIDNSALISRSDYRGISANEIYNIRVGLIEGYAHTALFREWYPDHPNTKEYESIRVAFDALDGGKVDVIMASTHDLLILTHYLERMGFKTNYIFYNPISITFAFNKNEAVLCSIVDKALRMINTGRISDNWMRKTYDYRSRLTEVQLPWVIGSFVLVLCVLALVAVFFARTSRTSKRLEKLVRERTHELEMQTSILTTLFDSIPDLIFTLNMSLRFTQCNKSFLEHFGFSREDIINKGEEGLGISAELTEEHNVWNLKVINEGRTAIFEERIPRVDGTIPLYETLKAPLVLDGKIIGLLGIARDITQRKEMEEAALAASRSKSAFLAHMSHEIRTPMNSIMGFSELAMDSEASPKTKDYLSKIKTNVEWLLQIINDILDISKVESGKMELENIPFDMHELFASCRALILPKALEKGIMLHFYAEPSIGKKPLGDPTRLRQVLVNILSNAVKFTNTGMVKVYTAIKSRTEKTITMYFEIKDSGIGMTGEQIQKAFEPFMQADTGTTRKYGGTGLGLPITKSIVEMMGGKLSVESTPGVGSKFSFELTFETIDVPGDDALKKKVILNELEKPVFEGEILLCEDNAMNQQVICEHLARVGLKTVVADNGQIGVDMVSERLRKGEKQFDLIFMDIHMPVMDGIEAAVKIIELETGIPIVAMTANIMSSDLEVYKTSGMHDCIGKPFTSQELWRCLLKYFRPVNWQAVNEVRQVQAEDELRKKLITNFVKDNRNKFSEIVKAIETDDIKLAHRLAHTLKGNAGQLGKTLLQKAAAEVELRLKEGLSDEYSAVNARLSSARNLVTEEQLKTLETELNAVLAEFTPLAAEFAQSGAAVSETSEQVSEGEPLGTEPTQELLKKLEPMLEMGNPECRGLIGSLSRIPGSEELIRQMENLDFGQALESLAKIRERMEK